MGFRSGTSIRGLASHTISHMPLCIAVFFAGRRDEAMQAYTRWLPLINYENRQCGLQACKVLMKEGGVIGSDAVRHPLQPLHPATRAGLIEIARQLDPVVLRWGR